MKTKLCFILSIVISVCAFSQKRNNVWCFGHHAGMDFNATNPSNFNSPIISFKATCSISDTSGQLLFCTGLDTNLFLHGTKFLNKVFGKIGNIIQNGDSIFLDGWYQDAVIIPNPISSNKFYLFTVGVTSNYGLYYTEIDISLNNGLGAVTQKNVQLYSQVGNDCLAAVKHGNGRDWWLIFRSAWLPNDTNDIYYLYLIDSNGINPPIIEHAGITNYGSVGNLIFNPTGNQFIKLADYGIIELFDFDRCTGAINSKNVIEYVPPFTSQFNQFFFSAFSPSGRYLYITEFDKTTYLHQYDLQAPNVTLSQVTIDSFSFPKYAGGGLKLAPDGKIYMSTWYTPDGSFYYPYSDTTYNMYNMNLSVINEPDSAGLACNFTKYSYYLGGNRTYVCLPNNPDYDLPGDSGCSNVSIPPAPQRGDQQIHTTYISAWEKLFINASGLRGKKITVSIYDGRGSLKFEVRGLKSNAGYFTLDVDCTGWASGLYVVHLKTEVEKLSKKFVKE